MIYTHAAAALIGAAVAFTSAWQVQNWRHDSAELAAAENVREVEKMRRQAANRGAAAHEADKVRIKTEFIEVTKEVERVVTRIEYRDRACLDPAGLRIIQSAISRANGDPGESGDSVPASAATP